MTTELEGGRFDFDDGGSYVGEWCEGRAHGLGIATGPENQGEYSGEWNMGLESRGVYIWPSGNMYSGTWLKGKRHGEGVQIKGRWIYRGAFTTGFCGRYGVKESLTSCAKYEGSWHLNQFDGFGVETNSDGSTYAGAWSKGMRQGLGVRRSAPYALAAEFNRAVRAAQSQNSLPSGTDSERGWRGTGSSGGGSGGDVRTSGDRGRTDERRSGFVLRSISCPSPASQANTSRSSSSGYRSATPSQEKKSLFKRGLFRKLRKQKSTGDLSVVGGQTIGGFSTSGSSSLFHSRGRRAGGSLRSNISTSSQLTTNSFGRGEGKILGNGGQGLHEFMDEPLGPNVTETYSGQWNEDRRSGYGVAERSDGLKYAGEWFNNKKDGYGVTYRTDGTKEEGRYKENILIQALNRKSKLFMLRHTKLRDAIEEAVRNAEDCAKKAKDSSCESAYQRAQTARIVAETADTRAHEAKKLSDEARAIAKEFSPDFVQPGLIWEKQNTLLRKDIFGVSPTREDGGMQRKSDSHNLYSNENTVNPDQSGQVGNSLEVSGGSRQGSFRSSFRRRANAQNDPKQRQIDPYGNEISRYPMDHEEHMANHEMDHKRYNANEYHGIRHHDPNMDPSYRGNNDMPNPAYRNQRTPGGRPIARAATTGVTGLGYSPSEQQQQQQQQQMAHHMAQHPHSPYLMASTSQHLDNNLDLPTDLPKPPDYGTIPRSRNRLNTYNNQPNSNMDKVIRTGELRTTEIRLEKAQLIQPSEIHRASVNVAEIKRDQVHQLNAPSPPSSPVCKTTATSVISENEESMSVMSRDNDTSIQTPQVVAKTRRRTLPSIMTEPPIQTNRTTGAKAGTLLSTNRRTGAATTRAIQKDLLLNSVIDEQTVHSAENLPADAAATYIIENGIRKRVQAETQHYQTKNYGNPSRVTPGNYMEGSRPEWTTAYDPYRPAMESTGVFPVQRTDLKRQYQEQESTDLLPLPKSYRIESVIHLPGTVKEASMPDISVIGSDSLSNEHGSPSRRRAYAHGYPVSGELTREEVSRLSQARRQELFHEMERRKKGEIVIRLADIKDWIRANFVIVFVLLINASLAFLFFNLLTNNGNSSSISSGSGISSTSSGSIRGSSISPNLNNPTMARQAARLQQQQANTIASRTVQTAKKVIGEVLKTAKAKRDGPGRQMR